MRTNYGLTALAWLVTALVLTACGGGGSTGSNGGGTNPPPIAPARTLNIVAAVGAPIVNGNINVICLTGEALTATTGSAGAVQITLSDQILPCAVQAWGGTINGVANSANYHSVATATGNVNVTPLTDLLVANLAGTATPNTWFAGLSTTPAPLASITQTRVATSLANLRTALSGLPQLGTIHPITTTFSPTSGNMSDDTLTALATAMANTGVTHASLLSNASVPAFAAPTAIFNTALTNAYAGTVSGGGNAVNSYAISGAVTGLTGTVVLQNNGGDNITLSANTAFTFSTRITSGGTYNVSVLTQPNGQTCTVTGGNGTATAYVSSVAVNCANTIVPPPIIPLLAPSGVIATSGDGQATINWSTVTGATSYNLFRASATGVTKSNYTTLAGGVMVAGVTSPKIQTGLSNGTPYYFVVTAVDANGESNESTQVTATPQATQVIPYKLNDTGIAASQCYEAGSDVFVACNSAGALSLNPAQDGMVGRDSNANTNSNTDGRLGFSFTAVPGCCVLDNVTGLMWEVKTADGGLRDWTKTYTNYSATYNPSALYGTATDATGFVTAVNAASLCGFSDWRLPTADELQSIVDYGVAFPGPTVDAAWFPNTQGGRYWSSSHVAGDPSNFWAVGFDYGYVYNVMSIYGGSSYVRLVRSGQ